MFPSTSQNQGLNKSKHFCRKVKVPAASETEGKTTEAPALRCNQIYCRGQTKAEDFMVSPAQLFQGFKLRCYFFALSASWGQKISLCHVNPVYVRSDLPQISVSWGEKGVLLSLHRQLQQTVCHRSELQYLPTSQTLQACCCPVPAGCWAFLDAALAFVLVPWGIQLCQ